MSVLAPAVGAVLAAILESSVLTHLKVGGVTPGLVFSVGIAVAMVLGFESGMTWAFTGGVALDLLLPGRALGSTALSLVLVIGAALLVARSMWPPRTIVIAATAFVLSMVYALLLQFVLSLTIDVAFVAVDVPRLIIGALVSTAITVVAAAVVRALELRFGEPERLAW